MGSRSTNLKCGIGGWKGRALITGDYLPFCTRNVDFIPNLGSHTVDRDDAFYGFDDPEITLRVVPGPQEDMFTQDGMDTFYGQPYTTTSRCDRMGFRLDGPEIETVTRQRYHLGRHRAGRRADPRRRPPHHHALRPPDHGRLREDRHRLQRRPAQAGAVHAGSRHPLRARHRPAGPGPVPPGSAPAWRRSRKMVRRPCYGGISPRRTARRLTPILEAQARAHASGSQKLWIELSKTEQRTLAARRAAAQAIRTDRSTP